MIIILDISYRLKHGFVSCILEKKKKRKIIPFLSVLTNKMLVAEKPSPDLSTCALKGRGGGRMHILPAFHGTTQNAHVCGCV